MQRIDISYDPYKMKTILKVDGVDVCDKPDDYMQFKEFIDAKTPLQTWIEPIPYKNWNGIINELKEDDESYDILDFYFNGRVIDFEDLQRACERENENRKNKLDLRYNHETVYSDTKLAQNVNNIMDDLLSDRFAELVKEQGEESDVYKEYEELKDVYEKTKQKEFRIVFAGLYSSGKSTILNSLIGRNVLPTSDQTCTAKTCKIRHNSRLKKSITLECFDKDENTIFKEQFKDDIECQKRIWEICPLGETQSNPPDVDLIKLEMDLSHLYPSRDMEKDFIIEIIDTPGCNSSKSSTSISKGNEIQFDNKDERLALEAITNNDREMVVICADAQDYEDVSIGKFLKAIHEASSETVGDFNDRFMFVLNKCDLLQYKRNEKIKDNKNKFASYIMNTERWGINKTYLKFVPRIFMISAYNSFAISQGVSSFTQEEIRNDEEKQNLVDVYTVFKMKVIDRQNTNFFLAQMCDIPDYRRKQYEDEFISALENDEDKALEIQTGLCCVRGAIQDYIARYAYPFKVKKLIETFDILLESIKDFKQTQDNKLRQKLDHLGKNITDGEEVEKKKRDEDEKKSALQRIKNIVNNEKDKIEAINIDMSELRRVREDIDVEIESDPYVARVRRSNGKEKLTDSEIRNITANIEMLFSDSWRKMDKAFSGIARNYKNSINTICETLNDMAKELMKINDKNGYSFNSSLALKKIQLRDASSLVADIQKTKEERSKWVKTTKKNPIKDNQYEWWQIFSKIKQCFAPDTIEEEKKITWNEYSMSSLKMYITDIYEELRKASKDAEKNYKNEIEKMKNNAKKMADDVENDIKNVTNAIEEFEQKIDNLGNNRGLIEEEISKCEQKIDWLNSLIDSIKEGGIINA